MVEEGPIKNEKDLKNILKGMGIDYDSIPADSGGAYDEAIKSLYKHMKE